MTDQAIRIAAHILGYQSLDEPLPEDLMDAAADIEQYASDREGPVGRSYFDGVDNSGHHYVIPWDKRHHWATFCEIPEDDERGWDVPKWAERIDGGTLTFTKPEVKRWDD